MSSYMFTVKIELQDVMSCRGCPCSCDLDGLTGCDNAELNLSDVEEKKESFRVWGKCPQSCIDKYGPK